MLPLLFLAGCAPAIQDVELRVLDDAPTMVEVTWTTRREVASHVRFGTDGSRDLNTPDTVAGTTHATILRGLPAESAAELQVFTSDGDESEVFEVETGSLGSGMPALTQEGPDQDHFLLAPLYMPNADAGPILLDRAGRPVWQYVDKRGLYVTRARLARDGSGVIYNSSDLNGHADEVQELVWVSWGGEEIRTEAVPLMGHDFVEKSDGTIVTVAFDERDEVVGTKLVEVAPDGTQTDTWSSWDCFNPEETAHDEMDMGWTFANALDYDEALDEYTVSFRNFGSLVSISGESGACSWVLGGVAGTVDLSGATFKHQHQFERSDDSVLVFDNDGEPGNSRVIEYALDPETGAADEVWSHSLGSWNVVLGDVHRLGDGDTLVVWAVYGQVDRVDANGDLVTRLTSEDGTVIGFTSLLEGLYGEGG